MRRVAFVPALDIKINVIRRDVIVLPKLEIIGKTAAGSRVDVHTGHFRQHQLRGAALQVNVFDRAG